MGRAPCCDKANVKKGPWSPEEDAKLKEYIDKQGTGGNWISLPQKAGLKRCGKSCRLRWLNYLRPNIKHGEFSDDEDRIICGLFANIGSRWSIIAAQLPGRTDNDIKNYWNTKLKKKLMGMINNNSSHQRKPHQATSFSSLLLHQASASSPSPSTISYNCSTSTNYYYTPARSVLTTNNDLAELNSSFSSLLSSVGGGGGVPIPQPQESFLGSMQNNYQVNKDSSSTVLMFGGDQASCSSSDGSCNNNNNQIISHGKELDQYHDYGQMGNLQNCFYSNNNRVDEENQKFMISTGCSDHQQQEYKPNLISWGDDRTPLDYGLEEIKQLISSTTSTTSNNCNNFLFDENKTEEKVMYY
ncbi:hypothetical protein LWI28_019423 [Acer negundo]|uniref:Uncharacterized protein n=1 Tax=Acer negundo TaxID=4023 RepID=A0AAD5NF40_ACENE|nr:hypothetical protein LWI28_019423 [Acer negundo]KAK4834704.1 hypothetical protein QYF36_027111 [Acer negundo]